ncbi:MAG: biotin--[acetyl-CoA-carboxylase] ligase [Rhizobiales bacterium]|nr:biotin--[acetyl-CoA-carboxylase] ligase [Hyphomicrobiales bacterium]
MIEFHDPSLDLAHFAFDTVGSTNEEAFALGKTRALDRLAVTALRQTSGRGRRGRSWVSEPGNLYASFFLHAPGPASACAELSFVAAVSLHEALSALSPRETRDCRVKWPNDILWNGRKCAGILLEAREARKEEGAMDVVVGIGVNIAHHPANLPYPVTDLVNEGIDATTDAVFDCLKQRFFQNLALWAEGTGFSLIRQRWLSVAHGLGDAILVRLANEKIRGRFLDLDKDGRLVLGLAGGGQRLITAGDVFFPADTR